MATYKILVADDQAENRFVLTMQFRLMGSNFEVLQAENGKEACDLAEKHIPDLIIMDWEMPEMNGIDAIKYIKSQEKTKFIPVIMATVHNTPEHLQEALKVGAMDYIAKPIHNVELTARVQSALRIHDLYREVESRNQEILNQNQLIKRQSYNQTLLKKKVFKAFYVYATIAFLVSIFSFELFKDMDANQKVTMGVGALSTYISSALEKGQLFFNLDLKTSDFYRKGSSPTLQQHYALIDSSEQTTEELIKLQKISSFEIEEQVKQINGKLKEYDSLYRLVVSKLRQRGDNTHGMIGALYGYLRKMEREEVGQPLQRIILSSHLADIKSVSADGESIEIILYEISNIKSQTIARYSNDHPTLVEKMTMLENFQSTFELLVQLDREIGSESKTGLTEQLNLMAENLGSSIDKMKKQVDQRENNLLDRLRVFNVLVVTFSVILTLMLTLSIQFVLRDSKDDLF